MKNCKEIRRILLTDYIDNEIDESTKKSIEEHLLTCHECKNIVDKVKEDIFALSDHKAREKVPVYLWQSIVSKIESERHANNVVVDFLCGLAERFTLPQLVPALAGIVLIVLSASFFLYTSHIRNMASVSGYEYTADILGGTEFFVEAENEGLGTPIEKYFL